MAVLGLKASRSGRRRGPASAAMHAGNGKAPAVAEPSAGPDRAVVQADRLGGLAVGREADIAIIDVVAERTVFEDTFGGLREGFRRIYVRRTIRAGVPWRSRDV